MLASNGGLLLKEKREKITISVTLKKKKAQAHTLNFLPHNFTDTYKDTQVHSQSIMSLGQLFKCNTSIQILTAHEGNGGKSMSPR